MKKYKVDMQDVKDFLRQMSYKCSDANSIDDISRKFDINLNISEFEFRVDDREYDQQWQNFQLDRHQKEYLPELTNWVSNKIESLIKEREARKAEYDQIKRRLDYSYELEINYYKNYKNSLESRNEEMSL